MQYIVRMPWLRLVLSIATLACVLPAMALPDADAISTSAAQTVIAGFTQTAFLSTQFTAIQSPTLTFTPAPSTFTPTQTLTPTQTYTPTLVVSATSIVPYIYVSVPTNCRSGPGKVYLREGALLVGEIAEVFARDPTGRYWYIHNPDSSGEFCWVWGEYASLSGNTSLLPIYTPPPTPTPTLTPTPSPNFAASYSSLDDCSGWWAQIKLKNTGSISFKSMGTIIKDTVTDVQLANYQDGFTNLNGCLSSTTIDTLRPGKTYVVSTPAFTYNPAGHKLRATLTLCSKAGQNGTCVTNTISFKP
jgi:hypothetical protein